MPIAGVQGWIGGGSAGCLPWGEHRWTHDGVLLERSWKIWIVKIGGASGHFCPTRGALLSFGTICCELKIVRHPSNLLWDVWLLPIPSLNRGFYLWGRWWGSLLSVLGSGAPVGDPFLRSLIRHLGGWTCPEFCEGLLEGCRWQFVLVGIPEWERMCIFPWKRIKRET